LGISFGRLRDAISRINSEGDIQEALSTAAAENGYDGFAYLDFQTSWTVAISNYLEEWQQHYFQSGYDKLDPIVATAKTRKSAFTWVSESQTKRSSPQVKKFWAEACDNEIRSGLTVPIQTSHGHMSMLTFASRQPSLVSSSDIDAVAAAAAVGQLHGRIEVLKALPTARSEIQLRPKERTFLSWAAEGKTMEEIASLEKVKYNSVKINLDNAKKRCDAMTLPQLVAMAMRSGLLK